MSSKMLIVILALVVVAIMAWDANVIEAQQVVTDGLVSYWTLDATDIDGETVRDVWGANDGTISGRPEVIDGKINEALLLDGSSTFVDCGNDESLDLTDALTIEVWMNPSSEGEGGPNAGPLCKAESGVDPWNWQLRYNAPGNFMGFQFNADPGGSTWISVQEALEPDTWYHVAGTLDGNDARCYLNGVETQSSPMSGVQSGGGRLYIGQDGWVNVFDGAVDEVRIYDRALSADEIQLNMNATSQLAVSSTRKLPLTWGQIKAVD